MDCLRVELWDSDTFNDDLKGRWLLPFEIPQMIYVLKKLLDYDADVLHDLLFAASMSIWTRFSRKPQINGSQVSDQ
jgi:hypothetical protein